MDNILSMEQLKGISQPIIQISNFDNTGTINVRVQKPKLMAMATQGKIPNHLMGVAVSMLTGKKKDVKDKEPTDIERLKRTSDTIELYCIACLVEPKYDDFKEIITDEQRLEIFNWGLGQVNTLDSFRADKGNGPSDNNGEEVSEEAK